MQAYQVFAASLKSRAMTVTRVIGLMAVTLIQPLFNLLEVEEVSPPLQSRHRDGAATKRY